MADPKTMNCFLHMTQTNTPSQIGVETDPLFNSTIGMHYNILEAILPRAAPLSGQPIGTIHAGDV